MPTEVIIIIVVAVVVLGVVYNIMRAQKIKKEGIVTNAVISRIKEIEDRQEDGRVETTYQYYATYTDEAGAKQEALLGNAMGDLREGQTVRIQYLAAKPKFALIVKE